AAPSWLFPPPSTSDPPRILYSIHYTGRNTRRHNQNKPGAPPDHHASNPAPHRTRHIQPAEGRHPQGHPSQFFHLFAQGTPPVSRRRRSPFPLFSKIIPCFLFQKEKSTTRCSPQISCAALSVFIISFDGGNSLL